MKIYGQLDWLAVDYGETMEKIGSPTITADQLTLRLQTVARDIAAVTPTKVTIVAVTKYYDIGAVQLLESIGHRDIAENRIQDLMKKRDAITTPGLRWHMIGPLQRNKARHAVGYADLIQSVDRIEIAEAINRYAHMAGKVQDVLLQVNQTGEGQKFGFQPDILMQVIPELCQLENICIRGVMGMGPVGSDDEIRHVMGGIRDLYNRLKSRYNDITMLSMGMSGDFRIAAQCGSTMVRLGHSLFQPF